MYTPYNYIKINIIFLTLNNNQSILENIKSSLIACHILTPHIQRYKVISNLLSQLARPHTAMQPSASHYHYPIHHFQHRHHILCHHLFRLVHMQTMQIYTPFAITTSPWIHSFVDVPCSVLHRYSQLLLFKSVLVLKSNSALTFSVNRLQLLFNLVQFGPKVFNRGACLLVESLFFCILKTLIRTRLYQVINLTDSHRSCLNWTRFYSTDPRPDHWSSHRLSLVDVVWAQ